jgi:Predicted glycosyltransferases
MFNKIITAGKKGMKVVFGEGMLTFIYKVNYNLKQKTGTDNLYFDWIKENEQDILECEPLKFNPKISVIVPVYNVLDGQLIECIESVRKQTYPNWELCLVDDASTWNSVQQTLKKYENKNNIKIKYRKENGHISTSTNDGIAMATGEFIAFLDCDDTLAPNALYEMAKKLNENPEYDFIYSDEDKISEDGKDRHTPFFKPEWSPDTLMSLMYTCHFAIYRRTLVDQIGGLRVGYEGAQDYDFTLRFTELTNNVGHISKILYHWRERKESTAINIDSKPYIFEATKKAKEDAITRRNLSATLEYVEDIYQYRVKYYNNELPKVSIIIPSKDNYKLLSTCIKSIIELTTYQNYEIVVVDNGSNEENRQLYASLCDNNKCTYHYEKMDFNFSKMCNIGSRLATGSFLLFLNDDMEVITKEWIELMVGHASLPYVGAVGAKLYYPNSKTIQHAGILNIKTGPSHSFVGFDDSLSYYYCKNHIEYNYIAVTGACLMIEKGKFEEVNGFDETFPVAYNDVDLCFKFIEKGYYNVLRADAILYHYESVSRGYDLEDEVKKERLRKELIRLYKEHPKFNGWDPFYSPHLTQINVDHSINNLYKSNCNKAELLDGAVELSTNTNIEKNIDYINVNDFSVKIEGWAFHKRTLFSNSNTKKIILVGKNGDVIKVDTYRSYRPDVTAAFGNKRRLNFAGFYSIVDKNLLKDDQYKVYLLYRNIFSFKKYCVDTNKMIKF